MIPRDLRICGTLRDGCLRDKVGKEMLWVTGVCWLLCSNKRLDLTSAFIKRRMISGFSQGENMNKSSVMVKVELR